MDWTEIIPLVVAVIAAITGFLALFKGRNKERADAAKSITEAAVLLGNEYQERIDKVEKKLERQAEKIRCQEIKIDKQALQIEIQADKIREQAGRIDELELERDEFVEGVMALCSQIRTLGHEPVWEPEAPDNDQ